ncbi:MAG: GNAT family N-acetyltransferase [Rhizobiaceae bacterium]|nr:GNAT family N-acetyltransferase [Rhizobiaceae bacterium]
MKLFGKNQFHISEARNEDYPKLADIHARGFDHGWSEDDIATTLAGKGVNCLTANIPGEGATGPKGFMIMRTLAGQSEVLTIAIDPGFRKRGMARALMEQAIRQLHKERIGQFFLEVSEYNLAALKLYQSLKFKQVSQRKSYYSSATPPEDEGEQSKANALVMQLELR